jgi:flagellar assembly protein FliH
MASLEQQASLTLDLILRQIGDLLAEHKNWTAEVHHDSISMAVAIMRKLAPELLRGSEFPQVEHIVNEAFQFLTDQPKVMIRVASELEGPLSSKVNLMVSRVGYEGQVVLTGDPELELTDCRISWYAGAVERSLDETWEQIDEMVDRVLRGLPAREHPEPRPVVDEEAEDEGQDGDEKAEDEDRDRDQDPVEDQSDGSRTDPLDELAVNKPEAQIDDGDPADGLGDDTIEQDENDDTGAPAPDDLANTADITPTRPQTEPARALASEE